jgi:hypothetical protein
MGLYTIRNKHGKALRQIIGTKADAVSVNKTYYNQKGNTVTHILKKKKK